MRPSYRFANVEVCPVERQVRIDGATRELGSRAFDLLVTLIEHRERLVLKSELLDVVWPGLVVEENNLAVQVLALRKLLGPKVVETIPGRGYRFAARLEEEDARAAAPANASHEPHLPPTVGPLIGRDAELESLLQQLAAHRLVTLVGTGGIGKTQLAREIASRATPGQEHSTWWVDLAAVSSPDKVVAAIANAAYLDLGGAETVAALAHALAQRTMLLVLDNCEHLAGAIAPIVAEILDAGAGVRLLVTSQEPLKVATEVVFRLGALAVPPPGTEATVARGFAALALFERRVQAIDRRFALTPATIDAVAAICEQLDGNPLAIEMAAARVPVLGLEELRTRLGERLRLLRLARHGAPARQQTLRATLDWSHSLLAPETKAVLRRLAVFAATFRLDSAQVVAAGDGLDEWAVLDALDSLAEKSLLQVEPVEPPRYRLLETTRIYAAEQLQAAKERDAAIERHGAAMAHAAAEAESSYWTMPDEAWLARFGPDYADLERAFDQACERADAAVVAATSQVLTKLDAMRNLLHGVIRRKQAMVELLGVASPRATAILLNALGAFRFLALPTMPREAIDRKRVAAWRELDEPRELYDALARLAVNLAEAGEGEAAADAIAEASGIEDPAWSPRLRLSLSSARTILDSYRRDWSAVLDGSRRTLALAREAGATRIAAATRADIAEAQLMTGDLPGAMHAARAAIAEFSQLEQPVNLCAALCTLLDASVSTGDLASARAAARRMLPLTGRSGYEAATYDHFALLAGNASHAREGACLLGYADARYEFHGYSRQPVEERAAAMATAAIERALGSKGMAHARADGALMTPDEAEALVQLLLPPADAPHAR